MQVTSSAELLLLLPRQVQVLELPAAGKIGVDPDKETREQNAVDATDGQAVVADA